MHINIGLTATQTEGTAKILEHLLANEFTLYLKTRNYHWNVVGIHFHDLHKLFEAQYEELDGAIDEIAERIRSLGVFTSASLTEFNKIATISDSTTEALASIKMIENLLADHETIIKSIRPSIDKIQNEFGDAGTADFLTGLMEKHEKTAWMLRSLLA